MQEEVSARAIVAAALLALLAGCATPPEWQQDLTAALRATRRDQQELVVFFALPGREMSDRMQARIDDPVVMQALQRGGFAAVVCDGVERKRLYGAWIGGGEGMGIAVLDGEGVCYCARPGPQDPEQVAALLDLCAASRDELRAARAALAEEPGDPLRQHALGCLYLRLGCRVHCEPLLLDAATAGVADARHRLARLYALDGNLTAARRWLQSAPRTPAAMATEGYVLFKERRHREAVKVFYEALATDRLGDERQRAVLYLGKSLHENEQDDEAVPVLEKLANEGTGSTFEAAARHTLGHIYNPDHGHTH
ncbi:MAG: tetratricopeptide repeat protein [Planctomycetota bacterium]